MEEPLRHQEVPLGKHPLTNQGSPSGLFSHPVLFLVHQAISFPNPMSLSSPKAKAALMPGAEGLEAWWMAEEQQPVSGQEPTPTGDL